MTTQPKPPEPQDEDYDSFWDDEGEDFPKCSTCRGSGTVNPLTAPSGFFCVSTTECPHCEGSGEIK